MIEKKKVEHVREMLFRRGDFMPIATLRMTSANKPSRISIMHPCSIASFKLYFSLTGVVCLCARVSSPLTPSGSPLLLQSTTFPECRLALFGRTEEYGVHR